MKKTVLLFLLAIGLSVNSQTTQMQSGYCNYTAPSFGDVQYADALPGSNLYRFQYVNSASSYTQVFTNIGSSCPCTAFYVVPGVSLATTYTVTVAGSPDNGITWSAYGSPCTLTTPGDYTTQIITSDCGITASSWTQLISCYQAGDPTVINYKFRLINSALSYTQVTAAKLNENFNFTLFTGLQPSATYTVDVSNNYNSAWQNYGPACTITTPPAPTTSLQPSYCGITATDYSELIRAEQSIGDSVKFQLVNSSLSYTQTFSKVNYNFTLAQFSGLQNSTTYSVSASVHYNGVWGPYGNACQITTPAAPTSSIVNAECGTTASSYTSQLFHAEPVTGFDCYFYNFTDGVTTYTLEKCNNNNFILSQLSPSLPIATTFTVTVKVKFNGSYGAFGNDCTITTPATFMRLESAPLPYPNPFTETATIEISERGVIKDAYGNIVEHLPVGVSEIGKNYAKGFYYLEAGNNKVKILKN